MSKKTKAENSAETNAIWTKLSEADKKLGEYIVTFEMVANPSEEEHRLAKDIVLLDHRSLRLLGPSTRERAEVRDLILNAVNMFHSRVPQVARSLLDRAEAIFLQHMQAKNRLRYLSLIFVADRTEQFIPTGEGVVLLEKGVGMHPA